LAWCGLLKNVHSLLEALASYCYIEIGDMSGFPFGKSKKFLFPSKFCFSTLNQVISLLAQID
jgi:hypothetical protein